MMTKITKQQLVEKIKRDKLSRKLINEETGLSVKTLFTIHSLGLPEEWEELLQVSIGQETKPKRGVETWWEVLEHVFEKYREGSLETILGELGDQKKGSRLQ